MIRGETPSPPNSHRGFHSRLNQSKLGLKSFIERTLSPKTATPNAAYNNSPTTTSPYNVRADTPTRSSQYCNSGRICGSNLNGRSRSIGVHRRAFTTIFGRRHKTPDDQSHNSSGDYQTPSPIRINERKKSASCSTPTTAKTMPPETVLDVSEDHRMSSPNFMQAATDRLRGWPSLNQSDTLEMSTPVKVNLRSCENDLIKEPQASLITLVSEDSDCELAIDQATGTQTGGGINLWRRHTDNGGNCETRTPNQISHLMSKFPFNSPANSILSEPSHELDVTPSPLNLANNSLIKTHPDMRHTQDIHTPNATSVASVIETKLKNLTRSLKKIYFGAGASGTIIDTAQHFKLPPCSKSLVEYYSRDAQSKPTTEEFVWRRFTQEDLCYGSQTDGLYQSSISKKALSLLGKKSVESTMSTNETLVLLQSPRDRNEAEYHSETSLYTPTTTIGLTLSKSVSHHAVCALTTAFEEGFDGVVELFQILKRKSLISLLYFTPAASLYDEFWPEFLMFFSIAFSAAVTKFNECCWQGLDHFKDLKIFSHPQSGDSPKPSLAFQISFLLLSTPTMTKNALQMFFNDSAKGRASLYWGNTHILTRSVLVHYADLIDFSKMNFETAFRTFVNHFPLVGESQHIYFATEAFARGYTLARLKTNNPEPSNSLVGDDSTLTMDFELKDLDDSSRLNSLLMGTAQSESPVGENLISPRCRFSPGSNGKSPTNSTRKLCWLKTLQETPAVSISAADLSVDWKLQKAAELEDTVLALAYAVVILNTSKHNQSLSRTKQTSITRQAFKQMVQAAAKYTVSESLLSGLYASISTCALVAADYNHTYFNEKRISVQVCTLDDANSNPCEIEPSTLSDDLPVPMIVNKLHRGRGRIQHRLIWINPIDESVNWCSPLGILSPAARSLSRMRSERKAYARGDGTSFEPLSSSKLHLLSPITTEEEKLQSALSRTRSPTGFKRQEKDSYQRLFSPRETWERSHSPETTRLGLGQSSKRSYTPPILHMESDITLERDKSAMPSPGPRSSSAVARTERLELRRTSESKDWIGFSIISSKYLKYLMRHDVGENSSKEGLVLLSRFLQRDFSGNIVQIVHRDLSTVEWIFPNDTKNVQVKGWIDHLIQSVQTNLAKALSEISTKQLVDLAMQNRTLSPTGSDKRSIRSGDRSTSSPSFSPEWIALAGPIVDALFESPSKESQRVDPLWHQQCLQRRANRVSVFKKTIHKHEISTKSSYVPSAWNLLNWTVSLSSDIMVEDYAEIGRSIDLLTQSTLSSEKPSEALKMITLMAIDEIKQSSPIGYIMLLPSMILANNFVEGSATWQIGGRVLCLIGLGQVRTDFNMATEIDENVLWSESFNTELRFFPQGETLVCTATQMPTSTSSSIGGRGDRTNLKSTPLIDKGRPCVIQAARLLEAIYLHKYISNIQAHHLTTLVWLAQILNLQNPFHVKVCVTFLVAQDLNIRRAKRESFDQLLRGIRENYPLTWSHWTEIGFDISWAFKRWLEYSFINSVPPIGMKEVWSAYLYHPINGNQRRSVFNDLCYKFIHCLTHNDSAILYTLEEYIKFFCLSPLPPFLHDLFASQAGKQVKLV